MVLFTPKADIPPFEKHLESNDEFYKSVKVETYREFVQLWQQKFV